MMYQVGIRKQYIMCIINKIIAFHYIIQPIKLISWYGWTLSLILDISLINTLSLGGQRILLHVTNAYNASIARSFCLSFKYIHRGYHMAARRYEISLQVVNNISRVTCM